TGTPKEELERAAFGLTKAELTHLISENLGLPDAVLGPIEAMHRATAAPSVIVTALRMADAYASGALLAADADARVTAFTKAQCAAARFGDDPAAPPPAVLQGEMASLTASLSRGTDHEHTQTPEPLFVRQ